MGSENVSPCTLFSTWNWHPVVKLLIISDAWHPQINGVVRTLEATANELSRLGHETRITGPDKTRRLTFSLPFYPEIKLEFFARRRLARVLREYRPDFIHIATEGPLGWAARRLCLYRTLPFTTAYHTRFPEYLAVRAPRVLSSFCTDDGLCGLAPLSRASQRGHGGYSVN